MKVIDSAIDDDVIDDYMSIITSADFPWFYAQGTPNQSHQHNFNLKHIYVLDDGIQNSQYQSHLDPFLSVLNVDKVHRSWVNCDIWDRTNRVEGMHQDREIGTTALFYLNTCNGFTLFEGGCKVQSKKGRMAMFPSSKPHSAVRQTNVIRRFTLTIVYS